MRTLHIGIVSLFSLNAFAGGGPSVSEDAVVYVFMISSLALLLGIIYLLEFIKKIRKDKDYRDHLKRRAINLIGTVRAIFVKGREHKNEAELDFALS